MTSQNSITAATQQVVHKEFRMLQQLGYEIALLTPIDWIDIYRRRQQLQRGPLFQEQYAANADSLAFLANQLAATHIQDVPFSFTSTASQIIMAARVVAPFLSAVSLCTEALTFETFSSVSPAPLFHIRQHLPSLLLPFFCSFTCCMFTTFSTLRNSRVHVALHRDCTTSIMR